jgi:hypothetical protein
MFSVNFCAKVFFFADGIFQGNWFSSESDLLFEKKVGGSLGY